VDEPYYLRRVEKLRDVISGPKESIFTKDQLLEGEAILDKKHFVLFRHLVEKAPNSEERNAIHLRSVRHSLAQVSYLPFYSPASRYIDLAIWQIHHVHGLSDVW
jgi:hypothetical protein